MADKFAPISEAIAKENCPLIKKVSVVDTYTDENGKSISIRMVFSDSEKTLTRDEVMEVANNIIATLEAKGISLKK